MLHLLKDQRYLLAEGCKRLKYAGEKTAYITKSAPKNVENTSRCWGECLLLTYTCKGSFHVMFASGEGFDLIYIYSQQMLIHHV